MTDDIYIYTIPLPRGVREMVTPCQGGYTVYLSESLDETGRRKAFAHAMKHIKRGDFERSDVDAIERDAHVATRAKRQN